MITLAVLASRAAQSIRSRGSISGAGFPTRSAPMTAVTSAAGQVWWADRGRGPGLAGAGRTDAAVMLSLLSVVRRYLRAYPPDIPQTCPERRPPAPPRCRAAPALRDGGRPRPFGMAGPRIPI